MYDDACMARALPEPAKDPSRTEFERDRARLLHSSALRRLGAKTQVLGPESDDFIRTRLTHSLEVAQIGRALGKNFGCDPDIVEAACLAHDLGHPPYGHNGETALDEMAHSIGGFEGNAQTLRILTRLEPKRVSPAGRSFGLNLTRACLDATIKYPWGRCDAPVNAAGVATKKFNVYESDREVFLWLRAGHEKERCVESQIMDLSDDIAYSIHDVEDAIVRGALNPQLLTDSAERERIIEATVAWYPGFDPGRLEKACERLLLQERWPEHFHGSMKDLAIVKDLTSDLIGRFVSAVTAATRAAYGTHALTRYDATIIIPQDIREEITVLKGMAVKYVMMPRSDEPPYFEQRTILYDLVDALHANPQNMEPLFYHMWQEADEEEKLRAIIDQVASLTDQSARVWHAHLCGMLRH